MTTRSASATLPHRDCSNSFMASAVVCIQLALTGIELEADMLSAEDEMLLTEAGTGKLMGELLRRFWMLSPRTSTPRVAVPIS